ncbi:MAG: hypothetical protein Tsb0034_04310 [Ekhidna sp.]
METITLLHGALGDATQLLPLKENLSPFFEVKVLEFDGHGQTSHQSDAFSVDGFVGQLKDFLLKMNEPSHLFGYSMGGFVALLAAAEGNSKIKSITTLGTKMKWNQEIAAGEVRHLNADKIKAKVPAFYKLLEERHGDHWIDVLERTADFMLLLGASNPMNREQVSKIDLPVLLLLADQDQMVTEEETEAVQKWIPSASYHQIENSHHPLEKVDLDMLTNKIRSFIGQHS